MINMEEPASEQELLNAGFEESGVYSCLKGIGSFEIFWDKDGNDRTLFRVYEFKDRRLDLKCPTKTELNKMLYPFIKRELCFEKKVKQYSLEECFNENGYCIHMGRVVPYDSTRMAIPFQEIIVYKTEPHAKQALALAKLSHIIAEIDKDYPSDNETSFHLYCSYGRNKDIRYDSMDETHSSNFPVVVKSTAGAEILMAKHEELLKLALMVE